jgi:phytoene/squalene synthetase
MDTVEDGMEVPQKMTNTNTKQMWWHAAVPACGKQRQEDHELEASLGSNS